MKAFSLKRLQKNALSAALLATVASTALASEVSGDSAQLADIMRLYGISESAAIDRLAKESEAADLFRNLESNPVPGYAGSWFDSETLALTAASNDPSGIELLRKAGASAVQVQHSLADLQRAQAAIVDLTRLSAQPLPIRSVYIDVTSNSVTYAVVPGTANEERARVAASPLTAGRVSVVEIEDSPVLSSNVVGANGTRNHDWDTLYGGIHPCSIAVSITEGFLTAGHCGYEGHVIRTAGGSGLGVVQESTFDDSTYRYDRGWVDTDSGWTPTATVNGYSDGTITIASKWSGMNESPVGATVCRYGQTSGGPHCGTISAKNMNVNFGSPVGTILGLTQLDGSCSDPGDSGGTHITPTSQVQGVNIGGLSTGCPGSGSNYALYQPVPATLDLFNKTMLSAHGANVPTLSGYSCPDMSQSGSGTYICKFDYFNSQGSTSIYWAKSTGGSSPDPEVYGSCSSGQSVTVTLAVTNPYGTKNQNATFSCPMGPIP